MLITIFFSLLPTIAQAGDWPMFRGDATNSGYTSESLTPPLKLAWKANVDGIVLSSPVISQGLVYAGSTSGYIYALEENTGKERWRYKTGGWIRWSPSVVNGVVYASSEDLEDNYVYALDAKTGQLKWKGLLRDSLSIPTSPPIVAYDTVYVTSKGPSLVDSGICALDASTGKLKWCIESDYSSFPAISNGILYVGLGSVLYALDTSLINLNETDIWAKLKLEKEVKWTYPTTNLVGSPSVSNGVIYVGSGTDFYAIDEKTGKTKWKGGLSYDASTRSSPSIANNLVYVTDSYNQVTAMDSKTGFDNWSYAAPSILSSSPIISNGIVYIGSGPYLQAIDARNGTLEWKYMVNSTLSSSPSIANNKLYIGADGYIYAFEKSQEPLIPAKIPLPLNKIHLFEGYSLIFSKLSFEEGEKEELIAELELQKDGIRVDGGSYKKGNIIQLGDRGQTIIKGNLETIYSAATWNTESYLQRAQAYPDAIDLKYITVYSESGNVIISDIGRITFSHLLGKEESGKAYWKLDNGYWLHLDIYPRSNQALFSLEKYGISIASTFVSVGREFSLKNDTGAIILLGKFEDITRQGNRIVAKLANIVQYPDSRVAEKTLTNLTDDELKNIQFEKSKEYKPSQIIMWNLSEGNSLRLQSIDPKTTPRQAWLIFEKNGQILDNMVVAEGQQFSHQKQVTDGNSKKDITILSGNLDRISLDPWYVVVSDVNLYSEWSGKSLGESASFNVPSAISSAHETIKDAGRLFADTSQAEYLLGQAQEKMWNGQYAESMSFAVQAKESAEGVRATRMKQYGIGSIFVICFTVITYFRVTANKRKIEEERRKLEGMKQEIIEKIDRLSENEILDKTDKVFNKKVAYKGGLKMSDEENIRKVKEAVEEAIRLIKEEHAGANLDKAHKCLSKAREALKNDEFEEAFKLAKEAQRAAKPDTDYLLSKAREIAAGAEKSFQSKNYENAIELWNKAVEEYDRAGELVRERKEQEILDGVVVVKNKIKDNITKAEIAIDNREMRNLVEKGNGEVEEANRLFEAKKFVEANKAYEEAKKALKEALGLASSLAGKKNFTDDRAKIEEALKSVEASIEACLLSEGEAMLKKAEASYEKKNFARAEEGFSLALEYLKGLKIERKKELEEMVASGGEGLIISKLEQGKEKMHDADKLFKDSKYYDAKEAYKTARDYLEGIVEAASGYKLSVLVGELNTLIQTCSQNISSATTAIMEVGDVEPEIIPVENVGKGTAGFKGTAPRQPVPVNSTVGKLMDKYAELDYLGGGGFADVYKGRKKDGAVVAVKVPRNLDEKAEEIFFREIRTWEKLSHRNIAKLIKPYLRPEPHIEIEYADGGSLDKALKSGTFDVEKACRVAFDIASGLEYAHSKHVVHGDINPKNILLNSIGETKIADFGLSKIATSSSEVKGYTLTYASKEQVEKSRANEKTDSYQLGLTFYVMLTGSNPFDAGSKYETEERIRKFSPEPPSKFNHGCSGLDDLVMRCLSKKLSDRPSPREFREFIYEFMKKNYNESLHLTEDIGKIITITCGHAMMAAKQGDIAECLRALNYAKGKVRDPDLRKDMKNLIEQVEFRAKNEITLEQLLDRMEIFLKKVEWEG